MISFIVFEIWEIIQWNKAIKITLGHGNVHSTARIPICSCCPLELGGS